MTSHDNIAMAVQELAVAFSNLADKDSISLFLKDLCTPAELLAMVERWRVVLLLKEGLSYRDIAKQLGVSVTTVGRVARSLQYGFGGYQVALEKRD